jgi:integrase
MSQEAHVVLLEGNGLAVVERQVADARPWCPFLFHSPDCKPGHMPSMRYGCVGDFKKAWRAACERAGLPVGRKAGGYVFHHTRNTAATNLWGGGMDEDDAMKITGHLTHAVFDRYNLGDVEKLRERLAASRGYVRKLTTARKIVPLHRGETAAEQRVAG